MTRTPTSRRRGFRPAPRATRLLALALSGAAVLAGGLLAQEETRPVMLRLDSREGASVTYVYEQAVDLIMPDEFGGEQTIRSSMILAQTTREITDEVIRLVTEVVDLSVEASGFPLAEQLDASAMRGRQFDMEVTRQGRLVDIGLTSADAAAGQIQQSLRQVGFPVLAAEPVRPGDTWQDTIHADPGSMGVPVDGTIVYVNHTTLERLSGAEGAVVAHLLVETTFRFEPGDVSLVGLSVEMSGSRADAVRFDVTNGRFLAARGQQDFTMSMAVAGSSGSFSVEGTARSSARLVDSRDNG